MTATRHPKAIKEVVAILRDDHSHQVRRRCIAINKATDNLKKYVDKYFPVGAPIQIQCLDGKYFVWIRATVYGYYARADEGLVVAVEDAALSALSEQKQKHMRALYGVSGLSNVFGLSWSLIMDANTRPMQ